MAPRVPIDVHPKFWPLIEAEHTIADIHGGRGGMKSTQVQLIALSLGIDKPMRICEARETMSSIKDSSHKMLSDLIYKHQMHVSQNGPYRILEDRIVREEGPKIQTEFIFVGVRENVRDQKSLAAIDLTIFEEAAKASQDSLDVFMPTVLREQGSKMWFIWNPELTTDPTYDLLINKPPTNTIHIVTSYLENPWLSDTMRVLAEDCKRNSPKKYAHIWMGEPISEVAGAIFKDELEQCETQGRICSVPYDPTKPVHTAWDLGFGDNMAIWFVQVRDGYLCFIDYLTDRQKRLSDYVIELNRKPYMYGEDHLPHDAVDSIIHHRLLGTGDKTMSIEMLMRAAGRQVRVAPKLLKEDSRNAARTIFSLCRFDAVKCAPGIESLRHYQWNKETSDDPRLEKPGKREPLHNWASHGCLNGDSLINTETGLRPIRDISVGDYVWTPAGMSVVSRAGIVGAKMELVKIITTAGELTATSSHKIFTHRGLVRSDALMYNDRVLTGEEWTLALLASISKVLNLGFRDLITGETGGLSQDHQACIEQSGRIPAEQSRLDSTYIMSMATHLITRSITSPSLNLRSISGGTRLKEFDSDCCDHPENLQESSRLNGTHPKQAWNGTGNTAPRPGKTENWWRKLVLFVASTTARLILRAALTASPKVVGLHLEKYTTAVNVYDLTVKTHHCYQANGILVSNSDAFITAAVSIKRKEFEDPIPQRRFVPQLAEI